MTSIALETSATDCGHRMERHDIVLGDGHHIGVSECGRGFPFVMFHGLGGEGMVYGRILTRIANLGFHVIAIDSAGHGRTDGLGAAGWKWSSYVELHRQVLDALEIDRAVLGGHSMGGKLAIELAAADPQRAAAVVAINAPIGRPYSSRTAYRRASALIPIQTTLLAADIGRATVRARHQMMRNAALITPGQRRLIRSMARVPSAFFATVWDGPSTRELRALRAHRIPTVLIHGDRDLAVQFKMAVAAAETADATLVLLRVHGGGHIWLLEDPGTVVSIMSDLLDQDILPATDRPVPTPGPVANRTWSIERRSSAQMDVHPS
ncbi:MAG: alpha/beta fold hydrolase [Acidimicrobiales bacterium]